MTVPRDPDAILAAWLEDGPDRLPDQTRRAIAVDVRTTTQNRHGLAVPWRTFLMSPLSRAAVAVLVAAAAIGGATYFLPRGPQSGGPSTPPPTSELTRTTCESVIGSATEPPTTPLDTATWIDFSSTRHGYDIRHPSGWRVTPATMPLTFESVSGAEYLLSGDTRIVMVYRGIYDAFINDTSFYPSFGAASTRIPDGMSEDDWLAAYDHQGSGPLRHHIPPRVHWQPVTVGGVPSGMFTGCGHFAESVTFVAGRAYTFTVFVGMGREADESDRDLLRAFLSTVIFHPELADDAP